jgi:hypothetical protein
MRQKNITSVLVILIIIISAIATLFGIFSDNGAGVYEYESIRGQVVNIYGKGIYEHMSADVAIQGIAQDFITLFIGIPLLLISLFGFRKGSLRSHFMLTGILGYFFVTYLFYTAMGMYNFLFLCYVALLAMSFFALLTSLLSFNLSTLTKDFSVKTPNKFIGIFLLINCCIIAFLWLSVIIPPLIDGSIYPAALEHYTTLIVQGLDLGLLLPLGFVSGLLIIKRKPMGYLAATVYIIFLSILMTALTAKIIGMALHNVNVIPAIFIIPVINLIAIYCVIILLKNIVTIPLNDNKNPGL